MVLNSNRNAGMTRAQARAAEKKRRSTSTPSPIVNSPTNVSVSSQSGQSGVRAAQSNQVSQQSQRARSLLGKQGTVKSYIGSDGRDTRFIDGNGQDTRDLHPSDPNYNQQVSAGTLGDRSFQGPLTTTAGSYENQLRDAGYDFQTGTFDPTRGNGTGALAAKTDKGFEFKPYNDPLDILRVQAEEGKVGKLSINPHAVVNSVGNIDQSMVRKLRTLGFSDEEISGAVDEANSTQVDNQAPNAETTKITNGWKDFFNRVYNDVGSNEKIVMDTNRERIFGLIDDITKARPNLDKVVNPQQRQILQNMFDNEIKNQIGSINPQNDLNPQSLGNVVKNAQRLVDEYVGRNTFSDFNAGISNIGDVTLGDTNIDNPQSNFDQGGSQNSTPAPIQNDPNTDISGLLMGTPYESMAPIIQSQVDQAVQQEFLASGIYMNQKQANDFAFRKAESFIQKNIQNASKLQSIQKRSAEVNKQAELAQLEADNVRQTNKIKWNEERDTQIANENKSKEIDRKIIQLAVQGGFGSIDAGQGELDLIEKKANQVIDDLGREYDYKRSDLAAQVTATRNKIDADYQSSIRNAAKDFFTTLDKNSLEYLSQTKVQAEENNKALTAFQKAFQSARDTKSGLISDVIDQVSKWHTQAVKDKIDTKDALWGRLYKHYTTVGSTNPDLEEKILQEMSDAGIDTTGLSVGNMTPSEIKNFADQGSANSTVSAIRKVYNGDLGDIASTINRLSYLVAPSKDERPEYRSNYYERIANGMSDKAIVNSLITDARTGRNVDKSIKELFNKANDTTGKIAQIHGLLDTYGVTATNDGPLGPIDAKLGKARSYTPFSSEAYNEISAIVGTLRQGLIKANYGSAVTDNEIKLAAEWLPDMNQKGAKFITNINNLRDMNEWLADTAFKRSFGLPVSPPPHVPEGMKWDPDVYGKINRPDGQVGTDDIINLMNPTEPDLSSLPLGDIPIPTTPFENVFMNAHRKREGYKTDKNAITITKGNNPGALKYTPSYKKFGATRGNKNFAMFPDEKSGYQALQFDIQSKLTGNTNHSRLKTVNNPTLFDYISVYAPKPDGNDPVSYGQDIVNQLRSSGYNVNLNTPLSELVSYLS